jgi:hypothetical protein
MCKKFAWLFIFLCVACSKQEQRLAICAMFKDEAPWMKEWIDYHHRVLGVCCFYLYNNDSSDQYLSVLQPYISEGLVKLIDWSSSDPTHEAGTMRDAPWYAAQVGAYNDCLKQSLGQAEWVAMIDIDEFIVPSRGPSRFYRCLAKAKKQHKGAVCLMWRVFGTSDVHDLAPGEFLIEKLTWRSRDDHPWNVRFKSIYQPAAVAFCRIHDAEKMNPGFGSITIKPEEVCINHYWARTNRFCLQKRNTSSQKEPKFFADLHQIEDKTIHQYLPALK